MRLALAFLLVFPLVSFAIRPEFGESARFAAASVIIKSVDYSENSLNIEFEGSWSEVPEGLNRLKSYPKNGFALTARTISDWKKLREVEEAFRARGSRPTTFSILTKGWVSYGGVPIFAMGELQYKIGD
ncbi:hypothetical protein BH09VER1_BH09VER1_55580 [soil metagenome]